MKPFQCKADNAPESLPVLHTPTGANAEQELLSILTVDTITVVPDFIIYFRLDKSNIDPTYMNNTLTLKRVNEIITDLNIKHIDSLIISAYASPEAPSVYNKRLSQRRADAVRNYLLDQFPALNPETVHAYGRGENWDGLRQLAEEDAQLPMRDEVLRIIDSNLPEDDRELELKALQGGTVYRYIYRNYYPRLRLGASIHVALVKTIHLEPISPKFALRTDTMQIDPAPIVIDYVTPIAKRYTYPLALRSNLLYDAIGAVNLGVELPFGSKKNWSLSADFAYSFWRGKNNLYAFQTLEYGLESRYWFGVKQTRQERKPNWAQPLKGFYVGIYGRYWQRYDVQLIDGYQGDNSWSAGLTAGYAIPLNRSLSFDFSIGAGWFSTSEYRHYHQPEYNEHGQYHLMWQETGRWSGLSLTKMRLALVWIIRANKTQERRADR